MQVLFSFSLICVQHKVYNIQHSSIWTVVNWWTMERKPNIKRERETNDERKRTKTKSHWNKISFSLWKKKIGKNRTFARYEFSLVLIKLYFRGLAILHRFSVRSLASAAILFFRRMTIRLVRYETEIRWWIHEIYSFFGHFQWETIQQFQIHFVFIEILWNFFRHFGVEFWVLCFWVDFQSTVICVCVFFIKIFLGVDKNVQVFVLHVNFELSRHSPINAAGIKSDE